MPSVVKATGRTLAVSSRGERMRARRLLDCEATHLTRRHPRGSARLDDERVWELRRHHPRVGHRPRIPRPAPGPAARHPLTQVAQAGALSAPRIEVLGEAAVDHRPGIQVSAWALAAGADIEK